MKRGRFAQPVLLGLLYVCAYMAGRQGGSYWRLVAGLGFLYLPSLVAALLPALRALWARPRRKVSGKALEVVEAHHLAQLAERVAALPGDRWEGSAELRAYHQAAIRAGLSVAQAVRFLATRCGDPGFLADVEARFGPERRA